MDEISLKKDEAQRIRNFIEISGARSNNLKNIHLSIPKNKLVVVTGLSGSGKSSLIMDTLFAEGQRRYVESLSSYARQFLARMKKPDVDYIRGICPAIAIEQKVSSSNARSTVGSLTELYDFLRLLYARIGTTYSPKTGIEVKKDQVSDVVDFVKSQDENSRILLLTEVKSENGRSTEQELKLLLQKSYTRLYYDGSMISIEDVLANQELMSAVSHDGIKLLIDRFTASKDDENLKRVADSVGTAFYEGKGKCMIILEDGSSREFSNRFEADGIVFLEPIPALFNYNNPYGACPKCEGYGRVIGIDPDKIIPDHNLSVFEGAIACWRGEKGSMWLQQLIHNASKFDFPIHRPYKNLTEEEKELLWTGNQYFEGINSFFAEIESQTYKIQNRVLLSRYRGKTTCPLCKGARLRKEALYVKVGGKNISELINIPLSELKNFFDQLTLDPYKAKIAERILSEINTRLTILNKIGLSYLTLDRLASTLSGGETQRINLTRTLGSNLTNSLYILDEPSVGLHPKDTEKLVEVLKQLRNLGNTVVVVEHEEEVIKNADYIIDIGTMAGIHGGELVFSGSYEEFVRSSTNSITAQYLSGLRSVPKPDFKRQISNRIYLKNCSKYNLKDIDVTIPLNALTVVCGVSGSGKTTLVKQILYPLLTESLADGSSSSGGINGQISGDIKSISQVEMITQSPIGKSSRSNPITYTKAYDSIRKLFADQQGSKIKGFQPKHFSFNVDGGRCETCKGEGTITVEMQFLADITLPCEDCKGQRFKEEVLGVRYNGLNIHEVLELSVEEALEFFKAKKDITTKIQPLMDVGLGYIKLGQSSSTLSGGEAQRLKLASFLGGDYINKKIFFIFDEPTTGLHFYDVEILLKALNSLVEQGHTVLIVEHNTDVMKAADWLIELGPVGGDGGGYLLYEGKPEGIINCENSVTAKFLKTKLQ